MLWIKIFSRIKFRQIGGLVFLIVTLTLIKELSRVNLSYRYNRYNFDGFNNETGADSMIIPNLVHFIRFNKSEFSFIDIICIRAAHVAQQPEAIYIHTNVKKFHGKYWLQLQQKWPDTHKLIQFKQLELPVQIFGRPLNSSYHIHHASDIERTRVLIKYGGIYCDNDSFLVRNLNRYRKFEAVIEWNNGQPMGNQVILAHKDARFLRLWLETFDDYRSDLWYYNGGELPTSRVLQKHPEIIHRIYDKFGTNTGLSYYLFTQNWSGWKEQDAIHLLVNHRHYMFKENFKKYPEFNEDMIRDYNYTFGEMVRQIYFN